MKINNIEIRVFRAGLDYDVFIGFRLYRMQSDGFRTLVSKDAIVPSFIVPMEIDNLRTLTNGMKAAIFGLLWDICNE